MKSFHSALCPPSSLNYSCVLFLVRTYLFAVSLSRSSPHLSCAFSLTQTCNKESSQAGNWNPDKQNSTPSFLQHSKHLSGTTRIFFKSESFSLLRVFFFFFSLMHWFYCKNWKGRLRYLTEMGRQLLAAFLALVGFMGTILIAALPMWKMSAFIGSNIVTAQVFYEGLWMNCVLQSTGHMQCKAYYSILALPQYLQATRALICVSLAVAVFGIGLMVVGARCTNFFRDDWNKKAMIGIIAGVVYIIAGILCLIAVSWSAYTIIQSFYNPQDISARKGEMGACIYIGWVAGFLLVLGGGLFISTYSNSCWALEQTHILNVFVKYWKNKGA